MKRYFFLPVILLSLYLCVLGGCTSLEMMTGYYALEGAAVVTVDRVIKSNDVILVKGINGHPNRLYMRYEKHIPFGPSKGLAKNGIGWFEYTENNRRIQIYDNVGIAVYGNFNFIMSKEALKEWEDFLKKWEAKYPEHVDFADYAHYLSSVANQREATAEWKQQRYDFRHRTGWQKVTKGDEPELGVHDYMTNEDLLKAGFTVIRYMDKMTDQPTITSWELFLKTKTKLLEK